MWKHFASGFRRFWIYAHIFILLSSSLLTGVESFNTFPNDFDDTGHTLLSMVGRSGRTRRAAGDDGNLAIKEASLLVPKNYSIHEPPLEPGAGAIKVDFYTLIVDVRSINEVQEELTLELNLQMYWKDKRLSHLTNQMQNTYVVLNPSLIDQIWHPDIFIDHVKKVEQPRLISTPASLRIYPDSTVRYSARLTIQMSCQMDFHYYPADTQRCSVDMKSYAYTNKILELDWREGKEALIKRDLQLPNFAVALGNTLNYSVQSSSGIYSGIRFTVILRRYLSFHMIQTYLPSTLFVIVSWLSFLVAPESIPGRMTLCMTTLLTLTAMFAAVRQITPNVSYVKGLDIWMVTCVIFVFFTLLEYTVLLRLKRLNAKNKGKKRKQTKKARKSLGLSVLIPMSSLSQGQDNLGYKNDSSSPSITSIRKMDPEISEIQGSSVPNRTNSVTNPILRPNGRNSSPAQVLTPKFIPPPPAAQPEPQEPPVNKYEELEARIELYFSKIIPALFITFNFVYWPWLLLMADYYNETDFLATHYAD